MSAYQQQFQSAVALSKSNKINQAIQQFQQLIIKYPSRYTLYTNLGVLLLKDNMIQKAIEQFSKAIEIDSFHYAAYHNRFMCFYKLGNMNDSLLDLKRALSCLYSLKSKLKNLKQNTVSFVKRSLELCKNNIRSMLILAQISSSDQNISQQLFQEVEKFIQENFSNRDDHKEQLKQYLLNELYKSKRLFYQKNFKLDQFDRYTRLYLQTSLNIQQFKIFPHINFYLISEQKQNNLNQQQIHQQIKILLVQMQSLMKNKSSNFIQKVNDKESQKNNINNDYSNENVQSMSQNLKRTKSVTQENIQQTMKQFKININKNQQNNNAFNVQNRTINQNNQNNQVDQIDQNNSLSIPPQLDQSSKFLNQQIKKLQDQIKQQGGKLQITKLQNKDDSLINQSAQQRRIDEEIEKAMEQIGLQQQIEQHKKQQPKNQYLQNSKKTNNSLPPKPQKLMTRTNSKIIRNQEVTEEQRLIEEAIVQKQRVNQHWLKHYMYFILKLHSLKIFNKDKSISSKTFYCFTQYNGCKAKTKPIYIGDKWDFTIQQQIGFNKFEIKVQLYQKGGFFSSDVLLATGIIHLLQKDATKCILESKDKKQKIGILNFEINYD